MYGILWAIIILICRAIPQTVPGTIYLEYSVQRGALHAGPSDTFVRVCTGFAVHRRRRLLSK